MTLVSFFRQGFELKDHDEKHFVFLFSELLQSFLFCFFLKRLVVRNRSITEQLRELWRTKPHFGVKVNILGLPVCFK